MDEKFIRDRITSLRMQKDISEYKMSLDLGHSKSYIQAISSGRAMPSMGEFLYICDYFGITPQEFFDENCENLILINHAVDIMKKLPEKDLRLIIDLLKRLENG